MTTQVGTRTTVVFGTSNFAPDLISVSTSGESREAIQTSHLGTSGYHTFIPSQLVDGGELSLEFFLDGNDDPPISGAVETITITLPDSNPGAGSGAQISFPGFMTSLDRGMPLEERMTATATVKVAGAVTLTDES